MIAESRKVEQNVNKNSFYGKLWEQWLGCEEDDTSYDDSSVDP